MSDIGCYSLDLYCDVFNEDHQPGEFPHIYTNNQANCKALCYKAARADGWIINSKFDRAFCPKCAKLKAKKRMQETKTYEKATEPAKTN